MTYRTKHKVKRVFLGVLVVVLVGTVLSFAGVEPLASIKDRVVDRLGGVVSDLRYEVDVPPGGNKIFDDWRVELEGGGWNGGIVTVTVRITNLGSRRLFWYGWHPLDLVAVDSTGKVKAPQPKGDSYPFGSAPYGSGREFYPNESWSGSLVFNLNRYSGETELYIAGDAFGHFDLLALLFSLGAPKA